MKTKKFFSILFAVALVLTASLMTVEVFAMSLSEYVDGYNESYTVKAMASVQANRHLNTNYFSEGFATLRIDPLVSPTSDNYCLELVLTPSSCGVENRRLIRSAGGIVSLTSNIRHINSGGYDADDYDVEYMLDDRIDSLEGRYFVINDNTGEEIAVPNIILTVN